MSAETHTALPMPSELVPGQLVALGGYRVRHAEGLDLALDAQVDLASSLDAVIRVRPRNSAHGAWSTGTAGWSAVGLLLGEDSGPYLLLWPDEQTTVAFAATIPEWLQQLVSSTAASDNSRDGLVRRAIRQWTTQLIDIGSRNNLLFFRPLRAGSLDLSVMRERAVDDLLSGRPVRLSLAIADPIAREDAIRRARVVQRKSRENFEERGLSTLFGAFGEATWRPTRGTAVPSAPILMRSATLQARGAAQADFDLQLIGEFEVNPVLLHLLAEEFKVAIDPDTLLERMDGVVDTPSELLESYRWLADQARSLPAFDARERAVLGNFLYAKLPMVKDLQTAEVAIRNHVILATIAGDGQARAQLMERNRQSDAGDGPDHIAPANEFLILDSDASQTRAIDLVRSGRDLVIKGPPGTGKSQTIANMIATLLADGKRVLFVAEKRAAIDAVFKRLHRVRLSDLLLDAHEGVRSRRQLAEQLDQALTSMQVTPMTDNAALHRELTEARSALRNHARAVSERRSPWQVTVHEAVGRLTALSKDGVAADFRFRGRALAEFTPEHLTRAQAILTDYFGLGGDEWKQSRWASSLAVTEAQAAALFADVVSFGRIAREAHDALARGLADVALPMPSTDESAAWLMGAWTDVEESRTHMVPTLWDQDLQPLSTAILPARNPIAHIWHSLTDSEYRAALATAVALATVAVNRADLARRLREHAATQAEWMRRLPGTSPSAPSGLAEIRSRWVAYETAHHEISERLGVPNVSDHVVGVIESVQTLQEDRQTLTRLVDLRRLDAEITSAGLRPFLDDSGLQAVSGAQVIRTLELAWLASVIEDIEFSDPVIRTFDAKRHQDQVDRFQQLDEKHLAANSHRIRRLYAERGIAARDQYPDQASYIQRQARLRRRHVPLRQLFRSAPDVLLAVKPCWAMSPLMVSQVLPNDRQYFDVVIFDEASQVTPADSVTAIMRGRSLVIAGDDKQLPPTSFFVSTLPEEESLNEEEELELGLATGFESVLDSLTPVIPVTTLDWHYRSQDEKLITFSNGEFYGGRLVTFPGARQADIMRHVLVNAQGPTSADVEADAVVDLILAHARARPGESLGVIALGIEHATRIDDKLRVRLRSELLLDDFFSEAGDEPFFVKNLERVQGDERDAIILSVGYGKSADGKMLYRFGPVNLEGGERRLNVAITRARKRMTVVSSFAHSDFDQNRPRSRGAKLLCDYLRYVAQRGSGREVVEHDAGDPLQQVIAGAIESTGLAVDMEVGASGQAVEIAVREPGTTSLDYRLAVELDGSTYSRAESVRDRERLREQQLGRLGWRYHRTYAFEWHRDPTASMSRILGRVNEQIASPATGIPDAAPQDLPPATKTRGPKPPIYYFEKIDDFWPAHLVQLASWVESDGLLRTEQQVIDEMIPELGFSKRGSRIVETLTRAIRSARSKRKR